MKQYAILPTASSVAARMTYGHPWDDIRPELILQHEPIARRVGYKFAIKHYRLNDTAEYGSVALVGLIEAIDRLISGDSVLDNPDGGAGVTKFLVKNMAFRCLDFLEADAVVTVPFRKKIDSVILCEADEDIRSYITDTHDFLNDFVSALSVTDDEKKMLLAVGQGSSVQVASELVGMNVRTAYRCLEKIRRWVV